MFVFKVREAAVEISIDMALFFNFYRKSLRGNKMEIDVHSLYNRKKINRWERVSVGDVFERIAHTFPDKEAIVGWQGAFADKSNARLTYKHADEKANQFANGLIKKGLQRGDRILFFCDNSVEAFLAKVAVAKAGMVYVPINTMMAPDVIAHIIDYVEPKFIVVDSVHWKKVQPIIDEKKLMVDITIPIEGDVISGSQSFEEFISKYEKTEPNVDVHSDDIWEILFTSGTTSMPKGVMISHMNTYFASMNASLYLTRGLRFQSELVASSFLPVIYHVGDQAIPFAAFLSGGKFIIGRAPDASTLAEAITKEKITALWGGPPAIIKGLTDVLEEHKDKYNPGSLTLILYGWGALDKVYDHKLKKLCGEQLSVAKIYGQTESISGYYFEHDRWTEVYAENSDVNYVGVPNPLLASVLLDDDGHVVTEPGIVGEVVHQSPVMMSGYYKDEKATHEAFKGGWFHSGDVCQYDENGLAIMVDRKKDVIKSGGENVSSIRVENILLGNPSVSKVAVVGVPNEKWGEIVTGVVVLKENSQVAGDELINYCRRKLAGFETPKQIIFVDCLPETIGGKVLKHKLREQLEN